jgi:hypothetical protein
MDSSFKYIRTVAVSINVQFNVAQKGRIISVNIVGKGSGKKRIYSNFKSSPEVHIWGLRKTMEIIIQQRRFEDKISKKEPTDNKPKVLLFWANLLGLGAVV